MIENLADLAEEALQRLGERRTLSFEGQWVSNVQTLDGARRLQTALSDLGVGTTDIVALCMVNHPLVYSVFQGIFRAGAAAVPLMFQLSVPELRFVLEDTQAVGVVTDSFNRSKVLAACEKLEWVQWIAVLDTGAPAGQPTPREHSLKELLASSATTAPVPQAGSDLAMLLYTSGTTGRPKGAMLSHSNLMSSAQQASDASELHRIETPRRSISAMPMAHIFGVGVMNGGFLVPERLAEGFMVQHVWFDAERFMAGIQEHRCHTFPAVPTMLSLILNHARVNEFDLTSLEEVICGAAPLPVDVACSFMERYGCRVREIYGMTESTGMGSANRMSEEYRPGSAGRAYNGTELRIISTTMNEEDACEEDSGTESEGGFLPPGVRGEVVMRGDAVMVGYLNRPDATEEALRGGWLHTGDIGYLDDDGYLFVVDRKKDMIIRGGENIYPAEIEAVFYQHPAVAEAAVVGIPDETYGEMVVGFLVISPDAEVTDQELGEFLAGRLVKFKIPSRIDRLEELPKSGVGKILRRVLRDRAVGAQAAVDQSSGALVTKCQRARGKS